MGASSSRVSESCISYFQKLLSPETDGIRLLTSTSTSSLGVSPNSYFREGQEQAIRHVIKGQSRLLVVQKTGWGKSFVYFIATKLLREAGCGPALLISPLLALMRNQIAAAQRMGLRAATINSENQNEWIAIERSIRANQIDILLISPERLANDRFRNQVLATAASHISLLIIDEAHCISDWGHDFRPHYRLLEGFVRTLPNNLRLIATTATANNRVMDDLQIVLGPNLALSRGDLSRPSLFLQTIILRDQAERLAWLAERVPALAGHGIIYTLTVRDAVQVTQWLQSRGLNVESYTGETGERREELEHALLGNRVKALVATTALGMGFDKPDLAFVIHYQTPGSVVAYYQQVGRAGRALDAAYGVLLSGEEDADIINYFIESAFPTRDEVKQVLNTMENAQAGLTRAELMERINLSASRIQTTLELLSLESPASIRKIGTTYYLSPAHLREEFWQRAQRLSDLRRQEQRQMQRYVSLETGHMEFLIRALDGEPSGASGPQLPALPVATDPVLVREALAFLRRTSVSIEPRKQWPAGGMPHFGLRGRIAPRHQAQPGKALCVWRDAGWSNMVRNGKYCDGYFDDQLVEACSSLVQRWKPQPFPAWVTCVPSLRNPDLVPSFARRLAADLGLPFRAVLVKTDDRPEQKAMANSIQQARNIDGSLSVISGRMLAGSVLLVDDMVDSRWTFTVAAWLLRNHGSGDVFPLALACTGHM
jgi:ATP-dependent DNA helicase RecQ